MSACPDTVYGEHGPLRRDGTCPWCDAKIGGPAPRNQRLLDAWRAGDGPDPLRIEPDADSDYHDLPDLLARHRLRDEE